MHYTPGHRPFSFIDRWILKKLHQRHPQYGNLAVIYMDFRTGNWLIDEPVGQDVIAGPITRHYVNVLDLANKFEESLQNPKPAEEAKT